MMDGRPAIEVRRLEKRFGRTEALAPLDLVVPRGSIFALVGHNGAGKTTLIKLLLHILRPSGGGAEVLGEPVEGLKGRAFQRIGYVSENQEMPEWMTVRGLMAYLRPFYARWEEGTLLADLDLPPERRIKQLSRGMKMKAALASVLAFRPELIVMDEPFSGLDPLVRDELIQTLLDRIGVEDEGGAGSAGAMTILISSHDLAEIETFATHVAFLHQGRLLFAESMERLTGRFREVTVRMGPGAAEIPAGLPGSWLLPESNGTVLRFVHSDAGGGLEDEVRGVLAGATDVEAEPMSLRAIFLALVKSNAKLNGKSNASRDRSRA
jgi:ABC-2 type transport system ATP-binding protein